MQDFTHDNPPGVVVVEDEEFVLKFSLGPPCYVGKFPIRPRDVTVPPKGCVRIKEEEEEYIGKYIGWVAYERPEDWILAGAVWIVEEERA